MDWLSVSALAVSLVALVFAVEAWWTVRRNLGRMVLRDEWRRP